MVSLRQRNNTGGDLLTEIVKGNVVLVLGHEGILNEAVVKGGNVKDRMYRNFIEYKKELDSDFNVSAKDFDSYFYLLHSDLEELKNDIVESMSMEQMESSFDSEEEYSPLLFKLLKQKYFRLVLTTTYDYYVEKMLEKVWGQKPKVISIYDGGNNDIEMPETNQQEMEPTLYYLFGRAEPEKDFVLIENDAIKVTEKWFSDKPQNLLKYLKDKTILALGTKFDDWLFRFFWFILHRDTKALKRGKVAISLNPQSETDEKLRRYLDNEKIKHRSMDQTIQMILDGYAEAEKNFLSEHGQRGCDIFISYHSKDYETVKHFFFSLDAYVTKENLPVRIWFDKADLNPGDEYRQIISNAIGKCKVFIPVITKNVKAILEEKEKTEHFFFEEEWVPAVNRKNMNDSTSPLHILPICLDGLEISSVKPTQKNYAEVLDQMYNIQAGTSKTQIEYDKFLATIKKIIKQS